MARENKSARHERRFGRPERLADMLFEWPLLMPPWFMEELDNRRRQEECPSGFSPEQLKAEVDKYLAKYGRNAYREVRREEAELELEVRQMRQDHDARIAAFIAEQRETMRAQMSAATVVVADNVAAYFYGGADSDKWRYADFPCVLPPFRTLFIEMGLRPGAKRWAWLLSTIDRDHKPTSDDEAEALAGELRRLFRSQLLASQNSEDIAEKLTEWVHAADRVEHGRADISELPSDVRWLVMGHLITTGHRGVICPGTVTWVCDHGGTMIGEPVIATMSAKESDSDWVAERTAEWRQMLLPALMTLSFMHCKNVVLTEHAPDFLVNRERRRNDKLPFMRYRTLNIEPMKKVLRSEGGADESGARRALHICRGHFSHYSEDKPLFGRIAGTFWIPTHVRGTHERGVVTKDYAVHPPSNGR